MCFIAFGGCFVYLVAEQIMNLFYFHFLNMRTICLWTLCMAMCSTFKYTLLKKGSISVCFEQKVYCWMLACVRHKERSLTVLNQMRGLPNLTDLHILFASYMKKGVTIIFISSLKSGDYSIYKSCLQRL